MTTGIIARSACTMCIRSCPVQRVFHRSLHPRLRIGLRSPVARRVNRKRTDLPKADPAEGAMPLPRGDTFLFYTLYMPLHTAHGIIGSNRVGIDARVGGGDERLGTAMTVEYAAPEAEGNCSRAEKLIGDLHLNQERRCVMTAMKQPGLVRS